MICKKLTYSVGIASVILAFYFGPEKPYWYLIGMLWSARMALMVYFGRQKGESRD